MRDRGLTTEATEAQGKKGKSKKGKRPKNARENPKLWTWDFGHVFSEFSVNLMTKIIL